MMYSVQATISFSFSSTVFLLLFLTEMFQASIPNVIQLGRGQWDQRRQGVFAFSSDCFLLNLDQTEHSGRFHKQSSWVAFCLPAVPVLSKVETCDLFISL